jgi:hypothetical protein
MPTDNGCDIPAKSLRMWLRMRPDTNIGREVANRPNFGPGGIDELCALLESNNLAAINRFSLLSSSLSNLMGAVRFERLRDAIDNFEFQLGAELLHQVLLTKHSQAVRT